MVCSSSSPHCVFTAHRALGVIDASIKVPCAGTVCSHAHLDTQ